MSFRNFEDVLPGCGWLVAEPYDVPIRAGLEAERSRLRGCKWVVVRYENELDPDGIWEWVFVEGGYDDHADAVRSALAILDERQSQLFLSTTKWTKEPLDMRWPEVEMIADRPITSLGFKLDDGSGWNRFRVVTAVMPLSDRPIDSEFISVLGKPDEVRCFLGNVGEALISEGKVGEPPPARGTEREDAAETIDGVEIPPAGDKVRFRECCDSDVFVVIDYRRGCAIGHRFINGKAHTMSAEAVHAATDMFKWSEMTREEFLSAVRPNVVSESKEGVEMSQKDEWTCSGRETLHWLSSNQLKTDPEWSVRLEKGFSWWPDRQRQTVEQVKEMRGPDGEIGYVIEVRTDVAKGVDLSESVLRFLDIFSMQCCTMAAPIYESANKSLSLRSAVRVHDGIAGWMNPLISVAAAMQAFEAKALGNALVTHAGCLMDESPHPASGFAESHDEIMDLEAGLFIPHGEFPSRWLEPEFSEAVRKYMQAPPSVMANDGGQGLTAEFPFGEGTSLLRMHADQRHPSYGSGLLVIQAFPIPAASEIAGIQLALEFNFWERVNGPFGYFFGSYAFQRGMLHFVSFYPNAMYRAGLLPNLYYAAAERARAVALRITGNDWKEEDFRKKRGGAFAKIFGRLGLRGS